MLRAVVVGILSLRAPDSIAQPPATPATPAPVASAPAVGPSAQSPSPTSRPAKLMQDRRVKRWAKAFSWTAVILLVFAFGAAAIVVFSRRFRDYLIRPSRKPTEYVDVWKLHKLPPESDAGEPGRPGGDGDNDN
jgi:hypothetical protein